MRGLKRVLRTGICILMGALAAPILGSIAMLPLSQPAEAKNWFQSKIGDGWKHGKWIPGLPGIHPKTPEELWPQCIGSPQDCRPKKGEAKTPPAQQTVIAQAGGKYIAQFRVQCAKSTDVGNNHGDVTIPYTSEVSVEDARQKALNEFNSGTDLCQKYSQTPSTDMHMIRSSGGFVG